MIKNKQQLKEVLSVDAKANSRRRISPRLFGDDIWKFIVTMRKLDLYSYLKKKSKLYAIPWLYYRVKYRNLSLKLGFSIPYNACAEGLGLMHYGTIVINSNVKIGKNCKIHTCVNIGATGGKPEAPQIGDNVYIGSGAKLIGDINIADGVCIGAGAVVVKSIEEPNTTWAGVPAKKISDNSSRCHLSPMLFEE